MTKQRKKTGTPAPKVVGSIPAECSNFRYISELAKWRSKNVAKNQRHNPWQGAWKVVFSFAVVVLAVTLPDPVGPGIAIAYLLGWLAFFLVHDVVRRFFARRQDAQQVNVLPVLRRMR